VPERGNPAEAILNSIFCIAVVGIGPERRTCPARQEIFHIGFRSIAEKGLTMFTVDAGARAE
jgi:hypothetical protein